jgi:hypothetical protein
MTIHVLGKQSICSTVRQVEALREAGRPCVIFIGDDALADARFARALFDALQVVECPLTAGRAIIFQ